MKIFIRKIYIFLRDAKFFIISCLRYKNWGAIYFFLAWRRSLRSTASPMSFQIPWVTFQAINIIATYLSANHKIFEYGGGGSTLYFLSRTKAVFTIEHDGKWFAMLKSTIKNRDYQNWQGKHVRPVKSGRRNADNANPKHYSSEHPDFQGYSFSKYAASIDKFEDYSFDLVLIDGRARPSCIVHAIDKVKVGGLLVIDNIDREYYLRQTRTMIDKSFDLLFDKIGPCPFVRDFTQTGLWRKKVT